MTEYRRFGIFATAIRLANWGGCKILGNDVHGKKGNG